MDWEEGEEDEEVTPAAFLVHPLDVQKMAAQIRSRSGDSEEQLAAAFARGAAHLALAAALACGTPAFAA